MRQERPVFDVAELLLKAGAAPRCNIPGEGKSVVEAVRFDAFFEMDEAVGGHGQWTNVCESGQNWTLKNASATGLKIWMRSSFRTTPQ